jgi:hypothetical protein
MHSQRLVARRYSNRLPDGQRAHARHAQTARRANLSQRIFY